MKVMKLLPILFFFAISISALPDENEFKGCIKNPCVPSPEKPKCTCLGLSNMLGEDDGM